MCIRRNVYGLNAFLNVNNLQYDTGGLCVQMTFYFSHFIFFKDKQKGIVPKHRFGFGSVCVLYALVL